MRKDINKRQAILDFIRNSTFTTGPTFSEIAVGIGLPESYRGNVYNIVQELIQDGYIVERGTGARAVLLTIRETYGEGEAVK